MPKGEERGVDWLRLCGSFFFFQELKNKIGEIIWLVLCIFYHDQTVETGRISDTDGHIFRLQFKSWQWSDLQFSCTADDGANRRPGGRALIESFIRSLVTTMLDASEIQGTVGQNRSILKKKKIKVKLSLWGSKWNSVRVDGPCCF